MSCSFRAAEQHFEFSVGAVSATRLVYNVKKRHRDVGPGNFINKHNKHASSKRDDGRIASPSRATCGADNAQCAGSFRGVHADSSSGRCTDCSQRTGEGDSDNRTYESTCKHRGDESTPADSPSTASCAARRAAVLKTQLTMRHGDAEIEPHFDRGPPMEYKNAHDDSDSNETHRNGRGTPRFRYIYGRPALTGRQRSAAKTNHARPRGR